jgi:hypothetical protein
MATSTPMAREIESLMKARYASPSKDDNDKFIDSLQGFISRTQMNISVQRLLQDAARTIHSILQSHEVSIGIKDPQDGKYRYIAVVGYTKEAEDALKRFSYSYEEFISQQEFPGIRISKSLDLLIGENQPSQEKEKKAWNRPTQLKAERGSPEEFMEADYLDVHMYSSGTDLVGWIEVSAPKDGKMPSGQTLKKLELFGSILTLAIKNAQARQA